MKHVVLFSSGAGSAGAARRVAERFGTDELILLFADVNGEHPDNYRFLHEAATWIGGEVVILDNDGMTIWDMFRRERFLGNSRIDTCSKYLKRVPTRRWLETHADPKTTTVYLGFDWTEEHRLERARGYWQPWQIEAPLCWDPVLDKADVLEQFQEAGIEPPLLTRLGFPHANCGGGCVKAGIKQFRQLLRVLPDEFARWEKNEQDLRVYLGKDVAILGDRRGGGPRRPLTLRTLREKVEQQPALFMDEEWGACSCMMPDSKEET